MFTFLYRPVNTRTSVCSYIYMNSSKHVELKKYLSSFPVETYFKSVENLLKPVLNPLKTPEKQRFPEVSKENRN